MVNFSVIDGHPGQVKLCLPLCPSVAANQLESPRSACAVPGRIYAARWSPPPAGGEPVKLSILLPTHRHSLQACSKIAQACSLAGPDIEVIVRDNSGNTRKRKLLANFQRDNCRLITVEPCGPRENYSETLRQATGDFVFSVGDDDTFFDHAVSDLPSVIAQIGADRSFIGITGSYAIETSKGTSLVTYQNIDSDDPGARAVGFLNYPGPNVLFYSVLRRELVNRVSAFMDVMPFFLSFHDQILSMLYLLSGKFLCLPRLMYRLRPRHLGKPKPRSSAISISIAPPGSIRRSTSCTGSCVALKARCWRSIRRCFRIFRARSGNRSLTAGSRRCLPASPASRDKLSVLRWRAKLKRFTPNCLRRRASFRSTGCSLKSAVLWLCARKSAVNAILHSGTMS